MTHDEDLYKDRIEEGDYCVLYEQEQWDGFGNNLRLLNFMKSKGWKFIELEKYTDYNRPGRDCIAKRTIAELLFEKIKK